MDFSTAKSLYSQNLVTHRLLALLWLQQKPEYTATMAELSEATGVRVSTLSESSRTWARDRIVTLLTPVSDKRSTTIALTHTGLTLLQNSGIVTA